MDVDIVMIDEKSLPNTAPPAMAPPKRLWQRLEPWALTFVMLFLFVFYLPGLHARVGSYHDDAIYIASGRGLALGQGYRVMSLPGQPFQTKYPPLYPALLSLVWRVSPQFPGNLVLLHGITNLAWLLALGWAGVLMRRFRYASSWGAALVVFVWGTSHLADTFTSTMLSEPLFTLLMVGAVWFAESAFESGKSRFGYSALAMAGLFAGLSALTRSAGGLLAVALVVAAAFRYRRIAEPAIIFVCSFPFIAGWQMWVSRHQTHFPTYDPRLYYLDYPHWTLQQFQHNSRLIALVGNAILIAGMRIPMLVIHILTPNVIHRASLEFPGILMTAVLLLLSLAITSLAVYEAGHLLRIRRPLLPILFTISIVPLMLYPFDPERFLAPVGFIILALMIGGCNRLLTRRISMRPAVLSVAVMVLLAGIARDLRMKFNDVRYARVPYEARYLAWAAANLHPGDRVLFMDDAMIYLFQGIQGVSDRNWVKQNWRGPFLQWDADMSACPQPEEQRRVLKQMGVNWILDVGDADEMKLFGAPALLQLHPEWFRLVDSLGRGELHAYRWRDEQAPAL